MSSSFSSRVVTGSPLVAVVAATQPN